MSAQGFERGSVNSGLKNLAGRILAWFSFHDVSHAWFGRFQILFGIKAWRWSGSQRCGGAHASTLGACLPMNFVARRVIRFSRSDVRCRRQTLQQHAPMDMTMPCDCSACLLRLAAHRHRKKACRAPRVVAAPVAAATNAYLGTQHRHLLSRTSRAR